MKAKDGILIFLSFLTIMLVCHYGEVNTPAVSQTNCDEVAQAANGIKEAEDIRHKAEVKGLKRRIKRLTYERDSLLMQNIRKDGLLDDSTIFIKRRPTSPDGFKTEKPRKHIDMLRDEHNRQFEGLSTCI